MEIEFDMTDVHVRTFTIDPSFAALCRFGAWFFAAIAVLSLSLPFWPDSRGNVAILWAFAIFGAAFHGILSFLCLRISGRAPYYAISMDEDGLWMAHEAKTSGLVRWQSIRSIRERPRLQRLDLIGTSGETLLKVEYQLTDFEDLRAAIGMRCTGALNAPVGPSALEKPLADRAFLSVALGLFVLGSLYLASKNLVLGVGSLVVIIPLMGYEYVKTVWRVVVHEDYLELRYPFRSHRVARDDIVEVELTDSLANGNRVPHVVIAVKGRRTPIQLMGLRLDSLALHRLLSDWWRRQ